MAEQVFDSKLQTIIKAAYSTKATFNRIFGEVQVLDGVARNETAFDVKTTDIPVVINDYNKDKDAVFGTGEKGSSRFGELKEIIYKDKSVDYDLEWSFNEGFDKFTVNADLQAALAERLDLQAQAKIRMLNNLNGKKLIEASEKDLGDATDVAKLFGKAFAEMTNLGVDGDVVAYVTPDLYNAVLDSPLTTTGKGSGANIDKNTIVMFKGFIVEVAPESEMAGALAFFSPVNIGKSFVGIETVRTLDAHDFVGVELQGAGKSGAYLPEINRKAIFTAGVTADEKEAAKAKKTAKQA